MFEEPFRWMEAISTRHSYVQEKLKKGQPVLTVPFEDGAVMLGFSPQPGKIFEVYDRIAMGGLGHPADVERLRMTLLDMAHLEGFNRSARDVTISRMLKFGIAPALKQNFEEVQRAPYLAQLLLAEIDPDGEPKFFRLNYDGHWQQFKKGTLICGNAKMTESIQKAIDETDFASLSLDKAMTKVCKIWEENINLDREEEDEEPPMTLKQAFEEWTLETAVLSRSIPRKCIFRKATDEEVQQLKSTVVGS